MNSRSYLYLFAKCVPYRYGAVPFAPARKTIRGCWSHIVAISQSKPSYCETHTVLLVWRSPAAWRPSAVDCRQVLLAHRERAIKFVFIKKTNTKNIDFAYLFHFFQPPVNSVKAPFVRDVVDEYYALSTARIRSYYGAETSLSGRIPQLQFDTFAVQQYCRCLVCCKKNIKLAKSW